MSGGTADLDPHLVAIARLYVDHMNLKGGNPPASQQAFEAFILEHGANRLKDVEPTDVGELFLSTRDHQPLVIFYGKASDPRLQGTVIAHEQMGVEGKRCIGMRYGTVQLVDQEQFERLVSTAQ
jgi:hypothetical protein